MMMTGIVLLFVLATAYVWCTRGFFSALIHMVCVLVAGAVAFGVWEPLSLLILKQSPESGTMSFLSGVAWALGLAVPFAVTLAILRVSIDKILPANAQLSTTGDYIGGGVCGLVSGVISAGILVLSVGYLRLDPEFMGYRSVDFGDRGSVVRSPGNLRPWVDRVTAGVYSHLSLTTMRTSTPLAVYRPELDTDPGAMRITFEGRSRNTVKRDGFSFNGWYIVGDQARPAPIERLLRDHWIQTTQKAVDVTGEPIDRGYLAGFLITFNSKAREKVGQVVVGNAQLRLVVQSTEDESDAKALHPVALIGRTNSPVRVEYARFRFDSSESFICSVGGESEAKMAFEFAVPEGYKPIRLYVKGVPVDLEDEPSFERPKKFADPSERDQAILSGSFAGMGDIGPILGPDGKPIELPAENQATEVNPVQVTINLGFVIQKGTEGGLEVAQEGRSGYAIRGGRAVLDPRRLQTQGLDPKLAINRYSVDETTAVVQVEMSPRMRSAEFMRQLDEAPKDKPPALYDTNGNRYEAVGFFYRDSRRVELSYDKQTSIRGLNAMPQVSRNNPDRQLRLVFVVNNGVEIREFRIGDVVMETYSPPIKAEYITRNR
jgi:hypothetical protein